MTKETAVQEFNWWVNNHINDLLDGTLGYDLFKQRMEATYLEFKEMEKEQIEWAYLQAYKDCELDRLCDSENYYQHHYGI
jgi:hypothetical protein